MNINHYSITSMLLMYTEIMMKSSFHNIWLMTNVLKIKLCFKLTLVLFCYIFYDCYISELTVGSNNICVIFHYNLHLRISMLLMGTSIIILSYLLKKWAIGSKIYCCRHVDNDIIMEISYEFIKWMTVDM